MGKAAGRSQDHKRVEVGVCRAALAVQEGMATKVDSVNTVEFSGLQL